MEVGNVTWEILAALITIVGSMTALGGVLAKLVRTLTKLDDTLIRLKEDVDKLRDGNHESHKRIYEKLDLCEERIGELERR